MTNTHPLAGNPYADDIPPENVLNSNAYSKLALAHEQRTANLIAWRAQLDRAGLDYQATDLYSEIEARLGMTEEP